MVAVGMLSEGVGVKGGVSKEPGDVAATGDSRGVSPPAGVPPPHELVASRTTAKALTTNAPGGIRSLAVILLDLSRRLARPSQANNSVSYPAREWDQVCLNIGELPLASSSEWDPPAPVNI